MSSPEYEWLELDADETIIWSGTPELVGSAWLFAIGIALIPLFGAGFVLIITVYLGLKNTAYVITTDSVFKKTGILSRKVVDIGHENIQDTSYKQSVVGRYFGFGTVQISTAGGSGVEMSLVHVADPLAVQSQLDRMALREPSTDERSGQNIEESIEIDDTTLTELLEEMRATRAAMESIEQRLSEE